ncbi:MAG: GntG family PLP-dependent aldolase [Chitinophagaceae bacterium]
MIIELRSDTFTKPGAGMLGAIMNADTGDDVFGEDPTVNKLEAMVAEMFGKEAAIYSPTGTMSNQIAIKCHTQPGDEVICEKQAHVYIYEGGGIAFNSGSQVKALDGDRGRITASQVEEAINPDDVHKARTSLVCLENTSNRGGGSCYDFSEIEKIAAVCKEYKLALHLDGARLFNALVAKGETPLQYGKLFDSISICLNKGLGCPIGSVLIGSREYIKKARRVRKVFGGGMRQAGFMAATGIFALDHNVQRLELDHLHAQQLAEALLSTPFVKQVMPVETNIVIAELHADFLAKSICEALANKQILALPIAKDKLRMVTHLDVTEEMVRQAVSTINDME